jgi:hypothetical protein
MPVKLAGAILEGIATPPTQFSNLTFAVEQGGVRTTLTAEENPLRHDWKLTLNGATIGAVIFSDRVDDAPFAETGTFYFAPGTASGLPGDANPRASGFQGTVWVDFQAKVNSQSVGGEFRLSIQSAFDGSLPQINSSMDAYNLARVQQRLNYFSESQKADYHDQDGKPLEIDGIFGPRTQAALTKFQTANHLQPAGKHAAGELDSVTSRALNSLNLASPYDAFTSAESSILIDGAKALGMLGGSVAGLRDLSNPLALLGRTGALPQGMDQSEQLNLSEASGIQDIFARLLQPALLEYLQGPAGKTLSGLVDFLNNWKGPTLPDFQALKLTAAQGESSQVESSVNVSLDIKKVFERSIYLGSAGEHDQISFNGKIRVTGEFKLNLKIGIDRAKLSAPAEAFFIEIPQNGLTALVDAALANASFSARLGLLGLDMTQDSGNPVKFHAEASLSAAQGFTRISLAQLGALPSAQLFSASIKTPTLTGALSATPSVAAPGVGLFNLPAGAKINLGLKQACF